MVKILRSSQTGGLGWDLMKWMEDVRSSRSSLTFYHGPKSDLGEGFIYSGIRFPQIALGSWGVETGGVDSEAPEFSTIQYYDWRNGWVEGRMVWATMSGMMNENLGRMRRVGGILWSPEGSIRGVDEILGVEQTLKQLKHVGFVTSVWEGGGLREIYTGLPELAYGAILESLGSNVISWFEHPVPILKSFVGVLRLTRAPFPEQNDNNEVVVRVPVKAGRHYHSLERVEDGEFMTTRTDLGVITAWHKNDLFEIGWRLGRTARGFECPEIQYRTDWNSWARRVVELYPSQL